MHKNWHNLPFIANDLISPSCQITTQNTRTSFATKKRFLHTGFYFTAAFIGRSSGFLKFYSLPFGKKITVLNVQF